MTCCAKFYLSRLATSALVALALTYGSSADANDQCYPHFVGFTFVTTCEGNQSSGVSRQFTLLSPPVELDVLNLFSDITPPHGVAGVYLSTTTDDGASGKHPGNGFSRWTWGVKDGSSAGSGN